jgi:hypothetical protein
MAPNFTLLGLVIGIYWDSEVYIQEAIQKEKGVMTFISQALGIVFLRRHPLSVRNQHDGQGTRSLQGRSNPALFLNGETEPLEEGRPRESSFSRGFFYGAA